MPDDPSRPPAGTATVDHARLARLTPGAAAWTAALAELGLDRLDRRAAPPALRALLAADDRTPELVAAGALAAALYAAAAGAAWAHGHLGALALPLAPAAILGALSLWTLLQAAGAAAWPRLTGRPAPWTGAARRDRALAALRAQPFVAPLGGLLVENIPELGDLQAWSAELGARAAAAEARQADIEATLSRMGQLRAALADPGPDVHPDGLRALAATEAALAARARALAAEVDARHALLLERLVELRRRAELERLRDHGRALLGERAARLHEDAALATRLDGALGELAAQVAAVRAAAEEATRAARLQGEVSALTRQG